MTEQFIRDNASADVRQLALQRPPEGVDLRWALQQIEGRQTAKRKLPLWAAADGIWFPPRINLEQCSSEATACYKRALAARLLVSTRNTSFVDLTSGFGVDFSTMAPLFDKATFVECDEELCRLARHNMPLLGLERAEIRNMLAEDYLAEEWRADIIMIDPARRDMAGRKTVLVEDCKPDVCALQEQLRSHALHTIIKLSPMLDITAALRRMSGVSEVHVIGSDGECKELLLVLQSLTDKRSLAISDIPIFCSTDSASFSFTLAEEAAAPLPLAEGLRSYIYEPAAAVLKAGAYRTLCKLFPELTKLAPTTHLYTSDVLLPDFPGRTWRLTDSSTFAKADLRRLLSNIKAAELSARGFPVSVAALRRQLHLREGGTAHFIATTLADSSRHLLKVELMSSR